MEYPYINKRKEYSVSVSDYIIKGYMKNIFKTAVRRVLFAACYLYSTIAVPITYDRAYQIGELSYLSKEDLEVWKRSMLAMLKEYASTGYRFRTIQTVYSFASSKIEVVRKTSPCVEENPIVVLCIKNDIKRIQMLVDHYRSLGVVKFAVMDNGSDDGTFEWLMDQSDVDLFRCYEPYRTYVKEGWINRIVSHYGFDRWYIVTDSDELLVFQGMEEHSLSDLVKVLIQKGYKRIKGLTLDAYPEGTLFGKSEDIRRDYKWIDSDSYKEVDSVDKIKQFIGGPRYRLMNFTGPLSKYPLVYWEKGTVSDNAHFQYPHNLICASPCLAGILHFKFIDKDFDEYEKRAQKNSGFSKGVAYKKYMEFVKNQDNTSFMYQGSVEFNSSDVLKKISFISPPEF